MRASWWAFCFLLGCSGVGGVQALAPPEASDAKALDQAPSASDYSAHLDLLALGYDDGTFEVRCPAPQHVLLRGKHAAAVINVALSADGQRLASVDREGAIAVSETSSGALKALPPAPDEVSRLDVPLGLAWDPAGKRLAISSDRSLRLIAVDGGAEKQVELRAAAYAVAFSPDARALAVGGRRIALLSVPELAETRTFALPTEDGWEAQRPHVLDLRFSPDGRTLGALLNVGVALFDLRTAQVEAALLRDFEPAGLRFAGDGRLAVFNRSALYVGPAKAEGIKNGFRKTSGVLYDVEFRRDDSLLFFGNGAEDEALFQ
jgi:WD40 repeat protein